MPGNLFIQHFPPVEVPRLEFLSAAHKEWEQVRRHHNISLAQVQALGGDLARNVPFPDFIYCHQRGQQQALRTAAQEQRMEDVLRGWPGPLERAAASGNLQMMRGVAPPGPRTENECLVAGFDAIDQPRVRRVLARVDAFLAGPGPSPVPRPRNWGPWIMAAKLVGFVVACAAWWIFCSVV